MTNFRHRVSGPGAAGDVWNTTFHSSSGQSLTTVHAAAVQWCTDFLGSTMAALWTPDVSATQIETDELINNGHTNTAQLRSTLNIVGTATGQPTNPRVAVVVGLRTALPTRAGRGRMFVPAPGAGSLTADGLLAVSVASSISSGAKTAFGTLNATSQLVIFHRLLATITPVNAITVGVVLGSQRRRTNKIPPDYQESTL